jgi:hypothetical protein
MIKPAIILIAIASVAGSAYADTAQSKQELAQKVLKLWHVEAIGQSMLQEPVSEAVQQARAMLASRAPAEKRDAAMRDIAEEAKKFLSETSPVVTSAAQKFAASTAVPMLAERFSEDELKELAAILESPVKRKFEAMLPEMQKAIGEKVAADTRATIDPKLRDMGEHINARLRVAVLP